MRLVEDVEAPRPGQARGVDEPHVRLAARTVVQKSDLRPLRRPLKGEGHQRHGVGAEPGEDVELLPHRGRVVTRFKTVEHGEGDAGEERKGRRILDFRFWILDWRGLKASNDRGDGLLGRSPEEFLGQGGSGQPVDDRRRGGSPQRRRGVACVLCGQELGRRGNHLGRREERQPVAPGPAVPVSGEPQGRSALQPRRRFATKPGASDEHPCQGVAVGSKIARIPDEMEIGPLASLPGHRLADLAGVAALSHVVRLDDDDERLGRRHSRQSCRHLDRGAVQLRGKPGHLGPGSLARRHQERHPVARDRRQGRQLVAVRCSLPVTRPDRRAHGENEQGGSATTDWNHGWPGVFFGVSAGSGGAGVKRSRTTRQELSACFFQIRR
jgi:hypothetical protein